MTESLTLRFTPTQQDYTNVLRLFFIRRTSTRVSLGVLALAFGLICYTVITQRTTPSIFELVWLILPPLFVAYVFFIQPSRMASQVIRNEQLVAEATWVMNDSGVDISSRFGSSHLEWDSLLRLVTTKEYYLLLNKVNKNTFRFLPKRAFGSSNDQQEFLALMRAHLPIN